MLALTPRERMREMESFAKSLERLRARMPGWTQKES